MLTSAWKPLRRHKPQRRLWYTDKKFIYVAAGRGSGKSEVMRRRQVRYMLLKQPGVDQPLHGYALPTFNQARRVAWEPLKALIPPRMVSRISESEMTIETVYGSKLFVLGMDKPERAEGVQWSTFVLDESSDQKPGVFDRSILPALSHHCMWCARIGVPKRQGPGALEFREGWEKARDAGEDSDSIALMWPSSDIVDPAVIEWARLNLDPKDYDEQYNANWHTLGGGVYHAFDEVHNISEVCVYRPSEPILVGSDFNVNPMCWVLGHFIGGRLQIFDELHISDTNTPATLDQLHAKYKDHKTGWLFTGDASGKSRKTSSNTSDLALIYNDARYDPKRVVYPKSNPPISSRISTVNAALCNAAGERHLLVSPRCTQTIRSFKGLTYKEGKDRVIDESSGLDHMSDAVGYLTVYCLPIRLNTKIATVSARAPR